MRSPDFTFSRRRCIAVDLGQSRIKAVLAERKGSRIEVLHAFTLDLQEEGLLTQEETNRHVSRILLEMGEDPVSLAIPQHIAVSHLIALPSEGKGGWERMIEAETQNLTGLSESAIVYDYFRLKPFGRYRNPVWVTVSRERELEDQIRRLQGSGLALREVTNTGNALASAYLATQPAEQRVILVDIGATATTVLVLERMQPVYATAFPIGGELFTEAVGAARGIPFDEAEVVKKTELLFQGEERCPQFIDAVERWQRELEKIIGDWLRDQTPEEEELKVILCGGSSLQPGFIDFVSSRSSFRYAAWRDSAGGVDPQTYAVAYGAALAGLKAAPVSSSLLPKPLRVQRSLVRQLTVLNTVVAVLLAIIFAILLSDSAAKRRGLDAKRAWIEDLEEAYEQVEAVDELLAVRAEEYNKIVPIVQQQKRARDLLAAISLMQRVRAEHDVWFLLLADGKSYFSESTLPPRPAESARPSRGSGIFRQTEEPVETERSGSGWNRFILELTVPGEGRETHEILRDVVSVLTSDNIFRSVDTLPAVERRELVDPSVTLPRRNFALNLELIPSQPPLPAADSAGSSLSDRP